MDNEEKIPDRLVDSCKLSNVNWMATGSRLPRTIVMELFSFF